MATDASMLETEGRELSEKLGLTKELSKGERLLLSAPQPQVAVELPLALRQLDYLGFDSREYDLRRAVTDLLDSVELPRQLGRFPEAGGRMLEQFDADDTVFRSFQVRVLLRERVAGDVAFLDVYERLVREVICPHLKTQVNRHLGSAAPMRFSYQYPPTLRIQPGRSRQFKRAHRDAEYGHQVGELNFWMPLTAFSGATGTGATLWVESKPDAGDFRPLDIEYGTIAVFHGTLCRHRVPANSSDCTRVSMDFRVGIGDCFDSEWALEGVKLEHGRRELHL